MLGAGVTCGGRGVVSKGSFRGLSQGRRFVQGERPGGPSICGAEGERAWVRIEAGAEGGAWNRDPWSWGGRRPGRPQRALGLLTCECEQEGCPHPGGAATPGSTCELPSAACQEHSSLRSPNTSLPTRGPGPLRSTTSDAGVGCRTPQVTVPPTAPPFAPGQERASCQGEGSVWLGTSPGPYLGRLGFRPRSEESKPWPY